MCNAYINYILYIHKIYIQNIYSIVYNIIDMVWHGMCVSINQYKYIYIVNKLFSKHIELLK